MKSVEMFFAMLPGDVNPKKLVRTRWRMTREEIARRGGIVLEHTREVRAVAETPDEIPTNTKRRGSTEAAS